MTERSQVQAGFSSGSAGVPLQWGLHVGVFPFDDGAVWLRLYPKTLGVKVVTSHGAIQDMHQSGTMVRREFVLFSGGNLSAAEFPITSIVQVATNGRLYDSNGDPVSGVSFSVQDFQLKASKQFTGAVYLEYATSYKVYKYKPKKVAPTGGSVSYEYGTVLSFYQGSMVQYTVNPPGLPEDYDAKELYRVYSEVQVNQEGAWEKPASWPSVTWTDPDAPQSEDDSYYEYERVHEVGYLLPNATLGDVTEETYFHKTEQGAPQASSYHPVYYYRVADISDFSGTKYESAFLTLDLNAIRAQVAQRYPQMVDA